MGRCGASERLPRCGGGDGVSTEACADRGEHLPVPRAEEAVRADVDASVRQHVLQKPTHARLGRHRSGSSLSSGRFLILKRDLAIPEGEASLRGGLCQTARSA